MRLVRLGPNHVFYRFLGPRWASLPTSGAGAARNGGRFNRPGVEALYLAREVETALAEYRQDASIVPPGTLVAYRLTVDDVIDFSDGYDAEVWPEAWAEHACDWKHIARIEKREPATWRIADGLIRAGHSGLLYPSARRDGGTNLILFPANLTAEDAVTPHDPRGDLPKDQSSWT